MKMRSPVVVISFVLLFAACALAQLGNQGTLQGTVTDPSGAVVPGARLTATNTATGLSVTTESGGEGYYLFAVLPVGSYEVRAEKAGFSPTVQKNVVISVGAKLSLDLKLGVAGATETVNVTAETPLVETTRTQFSSAVDANSVANLPVNGRNFIDFVLLTPGVTRDNARSGDISFGGLRGTLNSLTVDGADDNNTFFGQTSGRTGSGRAPYQFSQDAVQEFQVNSNGYSAELGRAGGAVINVITKSGTNQLHGTVFEFYRDRGLAANDPITKLNHAFNSALSTRKPPYHFHQFGGNIGGPVIKNRAFFFFDYDGQRNTQPNIIDPFPASAIPAAPDAFQAAALAYLSARNGNWSRTLNQDTYLVKGDVTINSSNQFSGRWNRQNFTGAGFENGGSTQSSEHTGASKVNSDSVLGTLTSTLRPTLINVFRYNYQQDNEPGEANSDNPEATVRNNGLTFLIVGRNSFSPRFTNIERNQFADTLTWTRGRHTLKFGFDYQHDAIANFFPGNFSGVYSFNSLENFGRSLAGQPLITTAPGAAGDSYSQAFAGPGTSGPTTHPNINEYSWFAQDDWRVRSNLTLNIGLRWDLQDTAKPPVTNPVALAAGINTGQLNLDTNNYGPRLGFAWQPWNTSTTVVRGGYGVFYGRTPSIMIGTAHSNNGINVQTKTFTGADIPAYPNTKCGAPVPAPNCAAPATGTAAAPSIFVMQPGFQEPIVQQANLNLEHQLGRDYSLTVGWQMVKGNHLQRTRDINLGTPTPVTFTIAGTGQAVVVNQYPAARPIAAFARIEQFESSANSLYHGGFVQLRKRFASNFQGMVSYTFSHVIDDAPDATSVVPFSSGDDGKMLFDPKCARCDRANSVTDQRHRFVLSGIWQLNYANGLNPAGKAFLGGWEVSTIFTAQSGQPYTGKVNSDINGDSNNQTDRAPIFGRNAFTLPANWSLDPRFTKNINFNERAKMQLFVEAFNIFNHTNTYAVKTTQFSRSGTTLTPVNTGVGAFGLLAAAPSGSIYNINLNGARVFQLGAKVTF
ncbi:MAG TPA: TonB-dependent receptor [Terriglobales bacterium]|nr:TonB-dependent receptor [Terriglobales bacterium]